jgi:hypothetical protein
VTTRAFAFWRRLDTPGHDACRLEEIPAGWQLEGTAVFVHEGLPARLTYRVACDTTWATRHGHVYGWLGHRSVDWTVLRTRQGAWTLNGKLVPGLERYVDLDLGFTPATNFLQLSRVKLADGETAEFSVCWLDPSVDTLTTVPQRYERRGDAAYWYEAPTFGYKALLEIAENGFVRRYPELWEMEG